MTIRDYSLGMTISTIFCSIVWVLVMQNVDPTKSSWVGFTLFYITLFLALSSLFSLVGFYLRRRVFENKTAFKQVEVAFRQGVFVALVFVGMMAMQGERVLNLYSGFIFIIAVVFLEVYFSTKEY